MTSATATGEVAEVDVPWRRLSVRMLAVHPVMEFVRALPLIFGVLILGSRNGGGGWWGLVAVVAPVTLGLLRWATTTYRVTPSQVEVRRGLFSKSVLTVPRDRVRSVDLTSHFMHRLLGLTRVAIGTGQTDRRRDGGLTLDGLSTGDGARLRQELLVRAASGRAGPAGGDAVAAPSLPTETVVARLNPGWIWYGPFTLYGLATIGVVAAFAWRTINETHVDPDKIGLLHDTTTRLAGQPLGLAATEVALAGLVVVALFSTVGYVLAFWNFRLTRSSHGTLHVSRGLITTRSTTIEERRLRGVEVSEPLLLRAVGGARAIAITTGLRVGRGAERGGSILVPPAPLTEVRRVAAEVLGDQVPVTVALVRHPGAALRRRLTRVVLAWLGLGGLAWLVRWGLEAPMWIVWAAVALLPLLLLLGLDRYRSLGHAVVDSRVVFRVGSVVRRRYMIDGKGVVGWTVRQSFFQRRAGLVTLTATTAAGRQGYELPDVDPATAVAIAHEVLPDLLTPFLVPAPGRS